MGSIVFHAHGDYIRPSVLPYGERETNSVTSSILSNSTHYVDLSLSL